MRRRLPTSVLANDQFRTDTDGKTRAVVVDLTSARHGIGLDTVPDGSRCRVQAVASGAATAMAESPPFAVERKPRRAYVINPREQAAVAHPASEPQRLHERQERDRPFTIPDPVLQLAGPQVQSIEHAGPRRNGPRWHANARPSGLLRSAAGARHQVQRPELIDTDHTALCRRVVIEVQHPVHRLHEIRGRCLPPRSSWPATTPHQF